MWTEKEERKRKGLHLPSFTLLLSNQIQLGFCCPIIEMFKCENRNDIHFERNVFTSTNENVPVALAIRSVHLSSRRKIEIVLRKCESPPNKSRPFHDRQAAKAFGEGQFCLKTLPLSCLWESSLMQKWRVSTSPFVVRANSGQAMRFHPFDV